MDYLSGAESRTVDGRRLHFIRCDRNGNELTDAQLQELSVTNETIESIVSSASARISMSGEEGSFSLRTL